MVIFKKGEVKMENLEYYAVNPKDQNNQFFAVHFILSEDKKTITRKDNGWSITFDKPLKTYIPRYLSWDGFEGWIDTLMRHDICLSREEAYIRLLEPKEDLKFIRKYHPKELKEFCERVTPFNSFNIKRMARAWFTLGYYKCHGINIHNLFYESELLEKFRPKNKFQFNIWKKITNVIYGNNIKLPSERITIAKNLNLANKGWGQLLSFLLYGKIIDTVVKLCREYPSDVNKLLSVHPNLLMELSPKYWDGSFKITHLVKGGANLKSLTGVNVKLSKTELTRAFKLYGDRCIDYTTPWLDIPTIANVKNIVLPHHWYHYIKNVVVLEWAHEKRPS